MFVLKQHPIRRSKMLGFLAVRLFTEVEWGWESPHYQTCHFAISRASKDQHLISMKSLPCVSPPSPHACLSQIFYERVKTDFELCHPYSK